jgi:glycosyltransferase involved in cell wall biosynthesis
MLRIDLAPQKGWRCRRGSLPGLAFLFHGRRMNDIVFVSLETWDEIWRRNQFLCAEFSKRHPGRKILFIGPPVDVSNMVRSGNFRDLAKGRQRSLPDYPNITVTRPLKLAPTTLSFGKAINELMARRHLRRMMRIRGLRRPVLWLNPHSALHLVGRIDAAGVVYDITDDWTRFRDQSERARTLVIEQDAMLCRKADAVIVCSDDLRRSKEGVASNLHLIPNGVDAVHYRGVLDAGGPLPAAAESWAKPVLGYTGTIHSERVDLNLIEALARHFSGGTVALVGPVMLAQAERERLRGCRNVAFIGAVSYREIPDYMRAFDVCITPHRVTPFTESLNPIKLWEYLAAGKPIVSTKVAGFRDYPELVDCAADTDGFINAVHRALHDSPLKGRLRQEEAERHSWSSRAQLAEEVMEQCVRARRSAARTETVSQSMP